MTGLHLRSALLADGWAQDVRLELDGGRIAALARGVQAEPGDERGAVGIPGLANLHSHAFQRAMAGLAEKRGAPADNFWSWRGQMYRLALAMRPDDLEAVAAELYVEMLEAGFTRVGEFHYLHHDPNGAPYASIAEMAERIIAAAERSGIGLTLLPAFYAHSGFGAAPPEPEQRRFVNSVEQFGLLVEAARQAAARLPGTLIGVAPHSLRAVAPEELQAVVALGAEGPIHIHAAEQVREVEECIAWSGKAPVAWLLDHAELDQHWCLIHATHTTDAEAAGLARSGAIVGLCPVTEANLGDGTFDATRFSAAGGRFGIGSDSNVEISAAAELRQLEYSQRLARRERNVLARPGMSTGRTLFEAACRGGGAALAWPTGLSLGAPADVVLLAGDHPSYPALSGDTWLDSWIFSAGNALIDRVFVGGKKLVEGGRHHAREAIAERYRAAIARLTA